eukprot:91752_1
MTPLGFCIFALYLFSPCLAFNTTARTQPLWRVEVVRKRRWWAFGTVYRELEFFTDDDAVYPHMVLRNGGNTYFYSYGTWANSYAFHEISHVQKVKDGEYELVTSEIKWPKNVKRYYSVYGADGIAVQFNRGCALFKEYKHDTYFYMNVAGNGKELPRSECHESSGLRSAFGIDDGIETVTDLHWSVWLIVAVLFSCCIGGFYWLWRHYKKEKSEMTVVLLHEEEIDDTL